MKNEDLIATKNNIHTLSSHLNEQTNKSSEILDIIDVLNQVYRKIDYKKDPEILVNHLVNFIRNSAIKGRIHFSKENERLVIDLSLVGQKAGWNSINRGDYSDKSQFYSWNEQVPRH